MIGHPENPPAFPVEHRFQVGDQTLEIDDVVVQAVAQGERERRLDVIAPVALRYLSDVRLFAPGSERLVEVEVTAARDDVAGTLDLEAPEGWKVTAETQQFRLSAAGDRARRTFTVRAPAQPASAAITARAHVGNAAWTSQRVVLRHEHIPVQLLQPARAAQGRCSRASDQGAACRLHPRRRRPRGRRPGRDGV